MKIFVTLGTQKFQFDRLLKKIDELIEIKTINTDDLTVQCVYSEYQPKNFKFFAMKPQDEIEEIMKKSDLIITHSGTGSIITSLKLGKKIIIAPRLKKYGEHVDDHQVELADVFKEKVNVIVVDDMQDLESAIKESETHKFGNWESNNIEMISSIDENIKCIKEVLCK